MHPRRHRELVHCAAGLLLLFLSPALPCAARPGAPSEACRERVGRKYGTARSSVILLLAAGGWVCSSLCRSCRVRAAAGPAAEPTKNQKVRGCCSWRQNRGRRWRMSACRATSTSRPFMTAAVTAASRRRRSSLTRKSPHFFLRRTGGCAGPRDLAYGALGGLPQARHIAMAIYARVKKARVQNVSKSAPTFELVRNDTLSSIAASAAPGASRAAEPETGAAAGNACICMHAKSPSIHLCSCAPVLNTGAHASE